MDKQRCSKMISGEGRWGSFNRVQCSRNAVVERDGELYCKQHDPIEIAKKNEIRQAKWDKKSKERQAKWHRDALIRGIFKDISTDQIENRMRFKQCPCCGNKSHKSNT